MNSGIPRLLGTLLLLAPVTAAAQEAPSRGGIDSVLRVLRLPRTTTEAREQGVPDSKIDSILDIMRRGGVPAGDQEKILAAEVEATRAGQPPGNFGAFVQAQHRAGLRGRALADAIHREQARRGMGSGKGRGPGVDDDRAAPGQTRGGRGGPKADTATTGRPPATPRGRKP